MNRPRRATLAVGLLLGLLGSAQAAPQHAITLYDEAPKYPADFQHFEYVNPNAPKGGTLRLSDFGGFDSLNPFIAKGNSAPQINLIYDTLTFHALDEPFTEYGLLAGKIEKDPEHRFVRYYLRPEAKFHDGTPVTADDVVFTFETLMKDGDPMYRNYYADVDKVVVEDKLRVRFDFKHGNNRELPLILGQLAILPKHWWATRDFNKTGMEPPMGSGPYRIAKVDAGRSIRYERVKDWWGDKLAVNRGFNNFDAVVVDSYRDLTVALEAFKAGQFDFNDERIAKNWATAYDSPAVRDGRIVREEPVNGNPWGMQGFVFNLRRPVFQDPRVREAIAQLFDFEWTNKQLFFGSYLRDGSYFENSEMAAHQMPDAEELKILEPLRDKLPPQVFTQVYVPPTGDGSGIIREQKRKAYQLLLEAGYKIENDKMVGPDGKPLTFEFMLAQADFERVLLPFKRNLAELGIDMQLRRVDVSQYVNRLRSRDYDMIVSSWPQSNSPGNEQREFWHSSSADKPGSRNFIGLRDPGIDALVDALINADSRESLIRHARALDRALLWGHYVVPNWYLRTWRIAYWNRIAHPENLPPYSYALMTWWQARDKAEPTKADAAAAEQAPTTDTVAQGAH